MKNLTEEYILKSSITVFLLYGYHATTLQQIADLSGVHKSAIHYYYRSKEKLYSKVVKSVVDALLEADIDMIKDMEINEKHRWFLFTELYNNQNLFKSTLRDLYADNWEKKLSEIRELQNEKSYKL